MANDQHDDFDIEMEKLRKEFHHRLIEDLDKIVQYGTLNDENLGQLSTLRKLFDASHKLAGAALTFGYKDAGGMLRNFEQTLEQALSQGRALEPSQVRLELNELEAAMPLLAAPKEDANVTATDIPAKAHRNEHFHLFVLEDEPSASNELTRGLSSFGYTVSAFTDIDALCAETLSTRPDGLIIDSKHSPFADEKLSTALDTLRTKAPENTPIIVVSPHEDFHEKLLAARHGVSAFLRRPVNIPLLEAHLDELLQQDARAPYRVLLVDDDLFTLEHHRLMLERWDIVAHTLADPAQTLDVIGDFHPDLLIFDLHMPLCTGIELAKIVRYHAQLVHIPIIYLSSERNENRQLSAMMTGGDDFIVKPVAEDNFVTTIRSRAQRARKLAELMTRDSLTGLLKHTEIKDRLAQEFARALRNKAEVCVAMVDIDHFKRVNDNYGHQAGDVVIATLAHLLRRGLRSTDIVGRYGGEEYMVIMPDTNAHNATHKLDLLRQEFATIVFRHDENAFGCTFSGGVCSSMKAKDLDDFVEKSDRALYQAKAQGRDRIIDATDS